MAALATGGVSQSGLVERGHLDQLGQFDPLDQKLRDAVAATQHDRSTGVEVDQLHLDLAAISGIDGAGGVDDRQSQARGQTGARVNQTHHALRDCHRDAGGNQSPLPGGQFDVFGAVQIHAGIALVRPCGPR